MKILFIGAVESSEILLRSLLAMGGDVVGVVTKLKSTFNADFVDISYLVKDAGTPVFYYSNESKSRMAEWALSLKPDVIFCFGWSHLIDQAIVSSAPKGAIGFHPSPLPMNRGRHPIVWTLALGLKETASSFFFIDQGVDEGDIVSQAMVPVSFEDDARTLYDKIMEAAVKQLTEFVPMLADGSLKPRRQNLSAGNVWRKRSNRDSLIDFRMSAIGIYNLVRALTKPYLGADLAIGDVLCKVWKAKVSETAFPENFEHGKVLRVSGSMLTVKCQGGAVELDVQELPQNLNVGDYL